MKLVDFGLTGGFTSEKKYGNEITGPLVLSEYHPAYIPIRGVAYMNDLYSLNVPANQIIKSAIIKVLRSESRVSIRKQYQMLLQSFEGVDVCRKFGYSGKYFGSFFFIQSALSISIRICYKNIARHENEIYAWKYFVVCFLHNSNDIFESMLEKF